MVSSVLLSVYIHLPQSFIYWWVGLFKSYLVQNKKENNKCLFMIDVIKLNTSFRPNNSNETFKYKLVIYLNGMKLL